MSRILLTHSPEALANYYGDRALARLRKLGNVVLHSGIEPLQGEDLIEAAGNCDLVVSYRQSPAPAALFERLPQLIAFLRCAIDIRNVDVAAASKAGVLVTQASAGFVTSVTELVIGFLVDLSRGITRHATAYHQGRVPPAFMAIWMPNARADGLAATAGKPQAPVAATAAFIAAVVSLLLLPWFEVVSAALIATAGAAFMAFLAARQIGGQTGDVLGAAEQIGETAILLLLAASLARAAS